MKPLLIQHLKISFDRFSQIRAFVFRKALLVVDGTSVVVVIPVMPAVAIPLVDMPLTAAIVVEVPEAIVVTAPPVVAATVEAIVVTAPLVVVATVVGEHEPVCTTVKSVVCPP